MNENQPLEETLGSPERIPSIAEVLDVHREKRLTTVPGNPWKYTGIFECTCGETFEAVSAVGGAHIGHRLHIADHLEAREAALTTARAALHEATSTRSET